MSGLETLRELWLGGADGTLCAREQAKAWGLREAWRADGKSPYGLLAFVACKLRKNGGGAPNYQAVQQLFAKMDEDDDWFPGKHFGGPRGRKRVLRGGKASGVCRAAKAIKASGGEATYGLICSRAPEAVKNPDTGAPVDKQAVYTCLRSHCYDKDPEKKWANRQRLTRKGLTADIILKRWGWSKYMRGLRHTEEWHFRNVVWTDICNTILATTEKKAAELALARKGNRTWCSEDSLADDTNLCGDKKVLKMNSWDTMRIWWTPILSRGKLHVEILPADFPGDRPEGAETLLAKVRAGLNVRFQSEGMPRVIFVDRGAGFYNPGDGRITQEFKAALQKFDLKAFMGEDAAVQPGKLSDLMLHETAVAWIRKLEARTIPRKPWEESREAFATRLKGIIAQINQNYDVEGLCRDLRKRVDKLYDKRGGKLRK